MNLARRLIAPPPPSTPTARLARPSLFSVASPSASNACPATYFVSAWSAWSAAVAARSPRSTSVRSSATLRSESSNASRRLSSRSASASASPCAKGKRGAPSSGCRRHLSHTVELCRVTAATQWKISSTVASPASGLSISWLRRKVRISFRPPSSSAARSPAAEASNPNASMALAAAADAASGTYTIVSPRLSSLVSRTGVAHRIARNALERVARNRSRSVAHRSRNAAPPRASSSAATSR